MSGVNVKVYGHIYPSSAAQATKLALPGAVVALNTTEEPPLSLDGDILRLCFEGVYFPLEDFVDALQNNLCPGQQGKIDYFDLEAWTLTRHLIANGKLGEGRVIPINNALEKT